MDTSARIGCISASGGSPERERDNRGVGETCNDSLTFGDFDRRDARRPDIGTRVVVVIDLSLASDDLGCHEERRAHRGVSSAVKRTEIGADAEVDQLDVTVARDENIVTFDIAMNDVVRMEVMQSFERFTKDVGDERFVETLVGFEDRFGEIGDAAARAQFHHEPELIELQRRIDQAVRGVGLHREKRRFIDGIPRRRWRWKRRRRRTFQIGTVEATEILVARQFEEHAVLLFDLLENFIRRMHDLHRGVEVRIANVLCLKEGTSGHVSISVCRVHLRTRNTSP